MTRTIISLEEQDKSWLERRARETGVPMAEVIREAIRRMQRAEDESFDQVLAATRGLWRKGDGLRYQRKLRREWK